MMLFPRIEETRPGLFVIRFSNGEIENGQHDFRLRKSDYYPYTIVLDIKDGGERDLSISLIKSFSATKETSPVGSNSLHVAKASQVNKNCLEELAQFVWIMQEGESKPNHLECHSIEMELSSKKRTWGPVKHPLGKYFDLWLDFGTESLGERRILNQWSKLLIQQNSTDVEFNVQGERMGAHSLVLKASSEAFNSILQGRSLKYKAPQTVNVNDIEPQVFQQLLHFIYTGRIPLIHEEGMVERIFKTASKYGLENLKDECARFVLANLTTHNIVHTLIWSSNNSLYDLHEFAVNFAATNYSEVCRQSDWKTIETYPQICLRISQLVSNSVSIRGP